MMYSMGVLFRNGLGVEKDNVKAIEWFEKAADQGNMLARVNLAEMLKRKTDEDGKLLDEGDDNRAFELYTLAADEQGDSHAMFSIGEFHQEGRAGLEKNDKIA